MKQNTRRLARFLKVVALAGSLATVSQAAIIEVGTGPDTSYLIIESSNAGLLEYAVSYTYVAENPIGTLELLDMVQAEVTGFSWANGASTENGYVNSITWQTGTEEGYYDVDLGTFIYWSQWVAGGQAGAGGAPEYLPAPAPKPGDSWDYGSGISAPYRIVEPGSYDALVFGDGSSPPSYALVPEPSTILLLGLVFPILQLRKRRK